MHAPDQSYQARLARYRTVSAHLSQLSDYRLRQAVVSGRVVGSGIGGRSVELDIGGAPVFVKLVPLTDIETRPENVRSTANLFGLPLHYQYGVGSAGFGAWRELAAHAMTTRWVLDKEYPGFPLTYHWRIIPDSPPTGFADEFGGIDGAVAHWEGSPAVRERLTAIGRSSSSIALFLEHVPWTLSDWLRDKRVGAPVDGQDSPATWVEEALVRGSAFLRARGFVHFDAHFANILTDGRLLYFADFGLALSSDFELSPAESAFLAQHLDYDHCYTASHLLRHLVDAIRGTVGREEFLRTWIAGGHPVGLGIPEEIAGIIDRHAAATVVLEQFHRRLLTESKQTPFPAAEIARARTTTAR